MYNGVSDPCSGLLYLFVKIPVLGVVVVGCGAATVWWMHENPSQPCPGDVYEINEQNLCVEVEPEQPYKITFEE